MAPQRKLETESKCFSGLREAVTLRIDGLEASILSVKELMAERDRFYVNQINSLDKANVAALTGIKEATMEALNSAKVAIADLKADLSPRLLALDTKLIEIAGQQSRTKGRAEGANWLWSILAGAAGIVLGILAAGRT